MNFNNTLIIGGAGSVGFGIVQELLKRTCSNIGVMSRSEATHAMCRDITGNQVRYHIGDIRDKAKLLEVCSGYTNIVLASALKRIEVGVQQPDEMVRTNINGVQNLIEVAHLLGTKRVLFISTDKAAEPTSVYGYTKAIGEQLMRVANNNYQVFSSVRLGNIAGSTGSVIPRWRQLITDGATSVPVTDPNCTRFWMTAAEAATFSLDTLCKPTPVIANSPSLKAFRLGDLATALGVICAIKGLPAYEKLHETMDGVSSAEAPRLSVEDLVTALKDIK